MIVWVMPAGEPIPIGEIDRKSCAGPDDMMALAREMAVAAGYDARVPLALGTRPQSWSEKWAAREAGATWGSGRDREAIFGTTEGDA